MLSGFNVALIPETDWLILAAKVSYEVANATVSPLMVKVALILKVPLASDVKELKASALAPCKPVFAFIASATSFASFTEAVKSVVKSEAKAFCPLILMSAA